MASTLPLFGVRAGERAGGGEEGNIDGSLRRPSSYKLFSTRVFHCLPDTSSSIPPNSFRYTIFSAKMPSSASCTAYILRPSLSPTTSLTSGFLKTTTAWLFPRQNQSWIQCLVFSMTLLLPGASLKTRISLSSRGWAQRSMGSNGSIRLRVGEGAGLSFFYYEIYYTQREVDRTQMYGLMTYYDTQIACNHHPGQEIDHCQQPQKPLLMT